MKKFPQVLHLSLNFLVGLIGVLAIIWVNYSIISGWFGKNGPVNIGSIEVSYVSMGRFLADFGARSWLPFWYFGFPFHVFYTPLLPFLEFLLFKTVGLPLWIGYRFLTGLAYILAPISVFLLGWQLSKKVIGGVIAGMVFSVIPTIFNFILGSGEVLGDRFTSDFYDPRRFVILVRWGEGPHIFSLIFIPLVGVFFARLLDKPKFANLLSCSIFLSLAALTNALGLFASLLLIGAMSFVKFAQTKANFNFSFKYLLLTVAITFGLISFWFNLTFLSTFFKEGSGSGSLLISLFPWGWLAGIVIILLIYFLISKYLQDFGLASALIWFLIFFTVVATYYLSAPAEESYRRIELLPQALRYIVEVDLSLSLLIGVTFAWLVGLITKKITHFKFAGLLLTLGFIAAAIFYIQPFFPTAQRNSSQLVDLAKSPEYKFANWFSHNIDLSKGERVLIPGNYGFFLNWFTNVWQLRGGLFQASTHHWPDHIYYQLSTGDDPEISRAWLIIMNAKYALVTTPGSPEMFHDFKNTDRYASLPIAFKDGADIIYQVPQVRPSNAKPVNIDQLKQLKAPLKGDDKPALLAYANLLNHSSQNQASFEMIDNDNYKISGQIAQNEAVSVSMTADSSWSAYDSISKKSLKTGQDAFGFLVIYPQTNNFNIKLKHNASYFELLGYLLSATSVFLLIYYGFTQKIPFLKLTHHPNRPASSINASNNH